MVSIEISNPKTYMEVYQIWYDKPIHEGHVAQIIKISKISKEYASKNF